MLNISLEELFVVVLLMEVIEVIENSGLDRLKGIFGHGVEKLWIKCVKTVY